MNHSTKHLRVASVGDSAMDLHAMGADGVTEYMQTRDPELVKCKPGMKLTWFTIRRIKTSMYTSYVAPATSESSQHARAFQMAVVKVEDLVTPEGDHHPVYTPTRQEGDLLYIGDSQIDDFSAGQLDEIGQVAMQRSRLSPKAPVYYRPLRSLLAVCQSRTAQEARLSRLAATKNPSSPSSAASPPSSPPSKPSESAPPTDASADDE